MGAAYFYHLTDSPLDVTLPMLLGKARAAGWRVLVRGTDSSLLERLDRVLWEQDKDGFLPHGLAGGTHDGEQPILLGETTPFDGFHCLMSIGGAPVTASEVAQSERTCILFDGQDGAAVEHARAQWRDLTDAQIASQYWAQEQGRWSQKAAKG